MEASERREQIAKRLRRASTAIVARELAETFEVSRQVIVGDIALLRASGIDILSTPKGYMMRFEQEANYKKKIVSQHTKKQTREELETILKFGGEIIDVSIEHPVYGEMNGALNIKTEEDMEIFLEKVINDDVSLLSGLTEGVHTHTIAAASQEAMDKIEKELRREGFLYPY